MVSPSTTGKTPSPESGDGGGGGERNSHPKIGIRRSGMPAPRPLVVEGWSLATERIGGTPRSNACLCCKECKTDGRGVANKGTWENLEPRRNISGVASACLHLALNSVSLRSGSVTGLYDTSLADVPFLEYNSCGIMVKNEFLKTGTRGPTKCDSKILPMTSPREFNFGRQNQRSFYDSKLYSLTPRSLPIALGPP